MFIVQLQQLTDCRHFPCNVLTMDFHSLLAGKCSNRDSFGILDSNKVFFFHFSSEEGYELCNLSRYSDAINLFSQAIKLYSQEHRCVLWSLLQAQLCLILRVHSLLIPATSPIDPTATASRDDTTSEMVFLILCNVWLW